MSVPSESCSNCCTCPTPVIQWDSVSASRSKCAVSIIDGVYYLQEVRCQSGKLRTTVRDPITCIISFTVEDDIRCCTVLYNSDGKRWAKRINTTPYSLNTYSDTRPTTATGSAYEDTTELNGSFVITETIGADCVVTCTASGSVTWFIERKGYYRDLESDPWVYDSLDRYEGSVTRNNCSTCTFQQTRTTFTGGFAEGNTEEDASVTTEGPNTSGAACAGVPGGEGDTVTSYENEVATAPATAYSNPYTIEMLRANLLADFASFDDDWNDTAGSYYDLDVGETTALGRISRYRIRFPIPKVRTGKLYRATWVERFTPEAGVAISGVSVLERGVYRPTIIINSGYDPIEDVVYGMGAQAVAVMSSTGTIASILMLNPGEGYSTDFPPTVTVSGSWVVGGNSTGWVATVTADGQISAITGGNAGNYRPAVTFNNGGGSGAEALATIDPTGGIQSVAVTSGGSGYRWASPELTISISGGSSARLAPNFGTEVQRCAVWDGTTLAGRWVSRLPVEGGSPLDSIEVVHGGNFLPFVTFTGGGSNARGARAVVTGFTTDGKVTTISVTAGGTGYTSVPGVVITGRNGGAGATATATISGGAVTSVTVVNQGNYLPTLAISGGGGSGATATVAFDGGNLGTLASVTLTASGSGYKTNPTLALSYYGTETVLLAAHFGTETEYPDASAPSGSVPVGYVEGVVRTYPILGNAGTAPWKYFELSLPTNQGTSSIGNLFAVCDGSACP